MSSVRPMLTLIVGLTLIAGAALAQTAEPARPAEAEKPSPLFAIVYRAGSAWKAGEPMAAQPGMREHFFYMREAHRRGAVAVAGPWGGDGGLILLRAADQAAAEAFMAADPAVTSGLFVG